MSLLRAKTCLVSSCAENVSKSVCESVSTRHYVKELCQFGQLGKNESCPVFVPNRTWESHCCESVLSESNVAKTV